MWSIKMFVPPTNFDSPPRCWGSNRPRSETCTGARPYYRNIKFQKNLQGIFFPFCFSMAFRLPRTSYPTTWRCGSRVGPSRRMSPREAKPGARLRRLVCTHAGVQEAPDPKISSWPRWCTTLLFWDPFLTYMLAKVWLTLTHLEFWESP